MTEQQIARLLEGWAPLLIPICLLLGPTLMYLLVSAFFGRNRQERPIRLRGATGEPVERLIDRGEMWVCPPCRALNTAGATRCYRCAAARPAALPTEALPEGTPAAPQPRPAALPVSTGVPVMAPTAALLPQTVPVPIRPDRPGATWNPAERSWCPLLGVKGNPRTVYSFPHPDHRCHALARVAPIAPEDQRVYCLTAEHPRCLRYLAAQQLASDREPRAAAAGSRR